MARLGHLNANRENARELEDEWRGIWRINGPPKLKHFLWRSCKGNLAVKEQLCQRHVVSDTRCSICNAESESILHSLFECEAANTIWQHFDTEGVINGAPVSSLVDRWRWFTKKLSVVSLQRVAVLMWAAWSCRNKILFEQVRHNFIAVAEGFLSLVQDYGTYAKKVYIPSTKSNAQSPSRWSCPPSGYVKVNTDAYFLENVTCGVGVVIRSEVGELLITAVKRVVAGDPEIAEAMAVRYGLFIAKRFGYRNILLESDALNVVSLVKNFNQGFSPTYLIVDDIRKDSTCFDSVSFAHVKRAGNSVAHYVARWDLESSSEYICIGSFPQSIQTLAESDLII